MLTVEIADFELDLIRDHIGAKVEVFAQQICKRIILLFVRHMQALDAFILPHLAHVYIKEVVLLADFRIAVDSY